MRETSGRSRPRTPRGSVRRFGRHRIATVGVLWVALAASHALGGQDFSIAAPSDLLTMDPHVFAKWLETARPVPVSAAEKARVLASLPREGEVTILSRVSRQRLESIDVVVRGIGREGVYTVKVIDVPQAAVAIHGRAVVLVSDPALGLLEAEELQAFLAHEAGHEYVWDEHEQAARRADHRRLRELELVCDAIAVVTLHGLGLDPSGLVSGIEKVAGFNARFGAAIANERDYPTVAERRAFVRSVVAWIASRDGPRTRATPSFRITHAYTGKEAKAIERVAQLVQFVLPDLLHAFDLALAEDREIRLEPHGECGHFYLMPFASRPPYVHGTTATVVHLHPCDTFFRRKPDEAAVVLGLEMLYIAGLPDIRDGQGRRQDVSALSARIRWLLPGHRKGRDTGPRNFPARTLSGLDAQLVRRIQEGAVRRLRRPECRAVLTDFVDAEGRSLAENLALYAPPADEYFARIALLDGSGLRLCDTGQARLVTTPNAQRIFVCKSFLEIARSVPYEAEVCLIHDVLHTLGLGENPPTSREITRRVMQRCPFDEK
jgi:hypothetical protein